MTGPTLSASCSHQTVRAVSWAGKRRARVTVRTVHRLEVGGEVHVAAKRRHGQVSQEFSDEEHGGPCETRRRIRLGGRWPRKRRAVARGEGPARVVPQARVADRKVQAFLPAWHFPFATGVLN